MGDTATHTAVDTAVRWIRPGDLLPTGEEILRAPYANSRTPKGAVTVELLRGDTQIVANWRPGTVVRVLRPGAVKVGAA